MRLLHLTPLLALAAAKLDLPSIKSLCPPTAPTDTLWLSDGAAYACAKLPGAGALAGTRCISAPAAELSGKADTCGAAADCEGGVCVEVGGGMRRVCWGVAEGGECRGFSKQE